MAWQSITAIEPVFTWPPRMDSMFTITNYDCGLFSRSDQAETLIKTLFPLIQWHSESSGRLSHVPSIQWQCKEFSVFRDSTSRIQINILFRVHFLIRINLKTVDNVEPIHPAESSENILSMSENTVLFTKLIYEKKEIDYLIGSFWK